MFDLFNVWWAAHAVQAFFACAAWRLHRGEGKLGPLATSLVVSMPPFLTLLALLIPTPWRDAGVLARLVEYVMFVNFAAWWFLVFSVFVEPWRPISSLLSRLAAAVAAFCSYYTYLVVDVFVMLFG